MPRRDTPGKIGQHEVQIDRVEPVYRAEPLGRKACLVAARLLQGLPQCGIGCPPSHVGRPFEEVAHDKLDEGLRKVRQPHAFHLVHQRFRHRPRQPDAAKDVALEFSRDIACNLRQTLYLVGNDGKALAGLARASGLDQCVDRQQLDLLHHMRVG
ncbi:hypothetical protein AJ87_12290 [Rhizobium yanglingense]|nr:hypothetical protein AJ87_12290 [Rhizobium yanglingense]